CLFTKSQFTASFSMM
ncbi:hypothetical protein D043_2914B, partial [Vibrio parahaemolyticus EKP-021]